MTALDAPDLRYVENRPFDEIEIGDFAELVRTLKAEDIDAFAVISGDVNAPVGSDIWAAIKEWLEKHMTMRTGIIGMR